MSTNATIRGYRAYVLVSHTLTDNKLSPIYSIIFLIHLLTEPQRPPRVLKRGFQEQWTLSYFVPSTVVLPGSTHIKKNNVCLFTKCSETCSLNMDLKKK